MAHGLFAVRFVLLCDSLRFPLHRHHLNATDATLREWIKRQRMTTRLGP